MIVVELRSADASLIFSQGQSLDSWSEATNKLEEYFIFRNYLTLK